MSPILVVLLFLVLAALLIHYVVPGGVQGMPGLLIFVVILVIAVAGGIGFGERLRF